VHMGQLFGMTRLVQQDLKRRKVGVPFDQRGDGAEAPERCGVKPPDRLCDPGTVVVDQDTHVLGNAMAGEMDLADRLDRQCLKIGERIEPEIPCADMDVVDPQRMPQPVRWATSVINSASGIVESW